MLPVVAGQWLINIGMVNALTSTFETGGSADYLKQFFEGEEEITAGAATDSKRAAATRARLAQYWGRAPRRRSPLMPVMRAPPAPPHAPATGRR